MDKKVEWVPLILIVGLLSFIIDYFFTHTINHHFLDHTHKIRLAVMILVLLLLLAKTIFFTKRSR